jgi:hypothetical protein
MLLVIDENVPDPVVAVYRDRGHTIILARERLAAGTADQIVAETANDLGAIVVTWNHRHFRQLAAQRRKNGSLRYPHLGLITYEVPYPDGVRRTLEHINLIEREYESCRTQEAMRLLVHLGRTFARVDH